MRGRSIPRELPLDRERLERLAIAAVRAQDPHPDHATWCARLVELLRVLVRRTTVQSSRTYVYDPLDGSVEPVAR